MIEGSAQSQQLIPPGVGSEQLSEVSELITPVEVSGEPEVKPVEAEPSPAEVPAPDDESGEPDDEPLPLAAEIDYDQTIPIGAGHEDATLGQLKDFWKENQDWHSERSEWDVTRMEQENEQMVVRQQLGKLVSMLGDVNPEVLEQLQRLNTVNAAREESLLLQARPEWSDPAVKAKASDAMLAAARARGFSEAEYHAIDDHRVIKALHDITVLEALQAKGKAAREKAAEVKKLDKPVPKKGESKTIQAQKLADAAAAGDDTKKAAYISTLIP